LSDVPEAFNSMKQVGLAVAIVLIFSFSYLCESFSAMNLIKSDIRNSLSYIDLTKLPKHIKYVLIINNSECS